MGFETPNLGGNVPPAENEIKKPKEGLGAEKNRQIMTYLTSGNYDGLLQIISQEQDKQTACEVIQESMFDFNQGGRANSVNKLLETALGNVQQYGDAVKELILYTYRNNLQGERFWKHPNKNEIIFVDNDGELISFKGELATFSQGENKGMDYIKTLNTYQVLTGPNAGMFFDGTNKNSRIYRPIQYPEMKK